MRIRRGVVCDMGLTWSHLHQEQLLLLLGVVLLWGRPGTFLYRFLCHRPLTVTRLSLFSISGCFYCHPQSPTTYCPILKHLKAEMSF